MQRQALDRKGGTSAGVDGDRATMGHQQKSSGPPLRELPHYRASHLSPPPTYHRPLAVSIDVSLAVC